MVASALYRNAAPMPRAISVNMFGLLLTIDAQPRAKSGAPAQNTTGIESASCTQFATPDGTSRWTRSGATISAIANSMIGRSEIRGGVESPRHVDELGVRTFVEGDPLWLQRHPAFWTAAGPDLPHFRVHRARVDGAWNDWVGLAWVEKRRRILGESLEARRMAKEIRRPFVVGPEIRRGIDLHPADGIYRERLRFGR